MIKTRIRGSVLIAPDGAWFHPDDPHEDPVPLMGKDGQPLTLEKQHYTGHNTAERADRALASPTPDEAQQVFALVQEQDIEDLAAFVRDRELPPDDAKVMRGVALMFVRGALHESLGSRLFQIMSETEEDWLAPWAPKPEDGIPVEGLCEGMDLPAGDLMCRKMAVAYWVGIFNDEQWEWVAHLLRKVKGSASEATPRQ